MHRLPQGQDKRVRNYKLVCDPALNPTPGLQKVYRYDGTVPGVCINLEQFYDPGVGGPISHLVQHKKLQFFSQNLL